VLDPKFVNYLATMFAVTNPFGNLAIFIGLTVHRSRKAQHRIAISTAFATAIILLVITWVGQPILNMLNISIPAFQMAGGLTITLIGLSMLQSKKAGGHVSTADQKNADSKESIAVVPLAIPIVAGPGAIAMVLVNVHDYPSIIAKGYISVANILIACIIAIVFFFAGPISRLLGDAGIKIAVRISGLILVSMAMGMLMAGIGQLFPALLG